MSKVESAKIALLHGIESLNKDIPKDFSNITEENSKEVNKILRDVAYLRVVYEWVSCFEDIEATHPEEVFEEILDGWRYYGDS